MKEIEKGPSLKKFIFFKNVGILKHPEVSIVRQLESENWRREEAEIITDLS